MGRQERSRALTLDRFASGKDGRANAFKKKKQAKKRKLFEKAQLKRRYAKLLKKEGMTTTSPPSHELEATKDDPEIGSSISTSTPVVANKIRRGGAEDRNRHQGGCDEKTHRDRGQEVDGAGNTKPGGKGKPLQHQQQQHQQHRPDPFKKAKEKAEQRRQEKEDGQRERERQRAEKESRAKERRKRHALLSKRTKGGQPVMKHTMQYLLEKIQAEQTQT